jgi:hypothetical protein
VFLFIGLRAAKKLDDLDKQGAADLGQASWRPAA